MKKDKIVIEIALIVLIYIILIIGLTYFFSITL